MTHQPLGWIEQEEGAAGSASPQLTACWDLASAEADQPEPEVVGAQATRGEVELDGIGAVQRGWFGILKESPDSRSRDLDDEGLRTERLYGFRVTWPRHFTGAYRHKDLFCAERVGVEHRLRTCLASDRFDIAGEVFDPGGAEFGQPCRC